MEDKLNSMHSLSGVVTNGDHPANPIGDRLLLYIVVCVIAVVLTMILSRGKVFRGITWGFVLGSMFGLGASLDIASIGGFDRAVIVELFFACYGAWLGGGIHAYRLRAWPAACVSLSCFAAIVVYGTTLWD